MSEFLRDFYRLLGEDSMRSSLRLLTECSRLCGTVKMRMDAESLEVLLSKVSVFIYNCGCLLTSTDAMKNTYKNDKLFRTMTEKYAKC